MSNLLMNPMLQMKIQNIRISIPPVIMKPSRKHATQVSSSAYGECIHPPRDMPPMSAKHRATMANINHSIVFLPFRLHFVAASWRPCCITRLQQVLICIALLLYSRIRKIRIKIKKRARLTTISFLSYSPEKLCDEEVYGFPFVPVEDLLSIMINREEVLGIEMVTNFISIYIAAVLPPG